MALQVFRSADSTYWPNVNRVMVFISVGRLVEISVLVAVGCHTSLRRLKPAAMRLIRSNTLIWKRTLGWFQWLG